MLNTILIAGAVACVGAILLGLGVVIAAWMTRRNRGEREDAEWRQREREAALATLVLVPVLYVVCMDGPRPPNSAQDAHATTERHEPVPDAARRTMLAE